MNKDKFFCGFVSFVFIISSLFLTGCASDFKIKAVNKDDAYISFSMNFTQSFSETFGELTGNSFSQSSSPFTTEELKSFLQSAQINDVNAVVNENKNISANGILKNISVSNLYKSKILKRTDSSLKLTLGSEQLLNLYKQLNSESQEYLDLLMIPCLNGEEMSLSEYKDFLGAVYGSSLASEITDTTLKIELSSPDAAKKTKASITLGELFTITSSKSWSVLW